MKIEWSAIEFTEKKLLYLGILSGDSKDTGQPHPENSPGPSSSDGRRNAHNVPCAYSGGQGGRQSAELADIPLSILASLKRELNRFAGITLNKLQLKGQENMSAKEKNQQGVAPDDIANLGDQLFKFRHLFSLLKGRVLV